MPYCRVCQRYLLSHRTGFVNSTATRASALSSKQPRSARKAAIQDAVNEVASGVRTLADRMRGQPLAETVGVLDEAARAANKSAAAWVAIKLSKCPTCDGHHVAFTMHSTTLDKKQAVTALLVLDKTAALAEQPMQPAA
jgi:hypothetical protein